MTQMAQRKESLEITMHVYSGRPNPKWLLDDTHSQFRELNHRLGKHSSTTMPQRLGYRGFTVERRVTDISGNLQIANHSTSVSGDHDLETFILETATDLEVGMKNHALQMIRDNDDKEDDFQVIEEGYGDHLPKYEPAKWDNPIHLVHNDSYNYANDIITDTNAIPGRATKHPFPDPPIGRYILDAALSDGLKIVHNEDPNRLPTYQWNLVALTFWPPADPQGNWDYHFYRLDAPGRFWSHKVDRTSVTNLDNSEKRILDPRYCNRGPYTEFVGFLQTDKDKVFIV